MKQYTKKIITLVMATALLLGSIMVDYRQPVSSRAEGAAHVESQGENNETQQKAPESNNGENADSLHSENPGGDTDNATGDSNDLKPQDSKKNDHPQEDLENMEMLAAKAEPSTDDISDKVDVLLWDFIVKEWGKDIIIYKDGTGKDDRPYSFQGRDIVISYKWEIKPDNIKVAKPGASFTFDLPEKEKISYDNKSDLPLMSLDNKEQFGHFSIENGVLTAVIDKDLSAKDNLHSGYFNIEVKCFKDILEFHITKDYLNKATDTFKPKKDPNQQTFPGEPGHFQESTFDTPILKDHYVDDERWKDSRLQYILRINHNELIDHYNKEEKPEKIEKKENVVVIDELPDGVELTGKIFIRADILAPATKKNDNQQSEEDRYVLTGKLSAAPALLLPIYPNNKLEYRFIEKNDEIGESDWEKFKEEVKKAADPTIGIWKKKNIIINFGKQLPLDVKYDDSALYDEGGLDKALEKAQERTETAWPHAINKAQAEAIKKYYAGQPITAIRVQFDTKFDKNINVFKNTATLSWEKGEKVSKENIFRSFSYKGGGNYGDTKIDVTVKKKWIGTPQDQVSITLLEANNNVEHGSYLIEKKNGKWELTIKNLPKTVDGENIEYIVKENNNNGYILKQEALTTDSNGNKEITITNIEAIDIPVQKIWKGINSEDTLPEKITVQLLKEGSAEPVQNLDLQKGSNGEWKGVFKAVPKYDESEKEIKYSVKEVPVQGYKSVVEGDTTKGFTITNTKTEKITIEVQKKWLSKANKPLLPTDSKIPAQIEVALVNKTDQEVIKEVTITKDNNWKHTFTDLEKVDQNGKIIEYQVKEKYAAPGFALAIPADVKEGKAELNNTLLNDPIRITVNKKWMGGEPSEGDAKDFIEVDILARKKGSQNNYISLHLDHIKVKKTNSWSVTVDNLSKYDDDGDELEYAIREVKIPVGYYASSDPVEGKDLVFTVTNTKIPTRSIHIDKKWADASGNSLPDTYQRIPKEIEIKLYSQKKGQDGWTEADSMKLTKDGGWKNTFSHVPTCDYHGNPIKYRIEEVKGADPYSQEFVCDNKKTTLKDVDDVTVTITNKKIDESVPISVTKKWLSLNGQSIGNDRLPDAIKIFLYANGQPNGSFMIEKKKNWVYQSTLPKFDTEGREYKYTIKEEVLSGYASTIVEGAGGYSFTVTNKEVPTPPNPYIPPYTPDQPIVTPPNIPTPPAPRVPIDEIVIEDDEVALANNDESIEDPEEEEITDDIPRANKDIPKTHDFLMSGAANPLAVSTLLMMGYGVKKLLGKKKEKKD